MAFIVKNGKFVRKKAKTITMFRQTQKFRSVRTDGMASKLEAAVRQILFLREKAGEIRDIKSQCRVELTLACIATKVDFCFTDCSTGETVYAEAKGFETDRWKIIKRLWRFYGPAKMEIWTGSYSNPKMTEEIEAGTVVLVQKK